MLPDEACMESSLPAGSWVSARRQKCYNACMKYLFGVAHRNLLPKALQPTCMLACEQKLSKKAQNSPG